MENPSQIIALAIVVILGASLYPAVTGSVGSSLDRSILLDEDIFDRMDHKEYLAEGTTPDGNSIKIAVENKSGTADYKQQFKKKVDWDNFTANAYIYNSTDSDITVTISGSNSEDAIVDTKANTLQDPEWSKEISLVNGSNNIDLSSYSSVKNIYLYTNLSRTDGRDVTTPELEMWEFVGQEDSTTGILLLLIPTLFIISIISFVGIKISGKV